ncbi:hypothetical protein DXG01_009279 [Tephrocybe rancida]|nr:hypothetical protein DXG01_009279 [Tephrocybe rancida]
MSCAKRRRGSCWPELRNMLPILKADGRIYLHSEPLILQPPPSLWSDLVGMPAPAAAVTVATIVGVFAVGYAFKKFVYEPHIAPKLEQWAVEYIAHRDAQRRQRAGAIPVMASPHRRDMPDKRSDSGNEGSERQSIELENLIAKEVREWRSEVNRSQTLRHRGKQGSSGSQYTIESVQSKTLLTSPTHVLVDPSIPSTPSSTLPSIEASPAPRVTPLREASSRSTLRSPPPAPPQGLGLLPTPAPSTTLSPGVPQRAPLSPGMIPSLSQSFPFELDQEHGVELLSAPSSRPDSPFSTFSQPVSPSVHGTNLSSANYYSFSSPNTFTAGNVISPLVRPPSRGLSDLDFLSDLDEHDALSPRWSEAGLSAPDEHFINDRLSDASGSSWASAGARSP